MTIITEVMDTGKDGVAVRNPEMRPMRLRSFPAQPLQPGNAGVNRPTCRMSGDIDPLAEGESAVSTGPSYQSQREEATQFADTLVGELANLPIAPPQKATLLAIKLKNIDLSAMRDYWTCQISNRFLLKSSSR